MKHEMGMDRYLPGMRQACVIGLLAFGLVTGLANASLAAQDLGPVDVATAEKKFQLVESARPVTEILPHWHKPEKMVVITGNDIKRAAWLAEAVPGVKVVGVKDDAAAIPELADADAVILTSMCTEEQFSAAKRLEWIHGNGGGTDQCLGMSGIKNGNILLTNSQKVKSSWLAEMAIGFMYALAQNLDIATENTRLAEFNAVRGRPRLSIEGSTMLIVGLGGAGTEIARQAHEAGMRVIATRASGHEGPAYVEYVGLANELPTLIGQADVVVIAAPLTPETNGLFNAAMFAKMKRGAMLIDFTRAEIVNAVDLAAALKNGQVGSAGINWATVEPLPKDNPLWHAPNIILTPWGGPMAAVNRAAPSDNARQVRPAPAPNAADQYESELRWVMVRENMRRFAQGEKMYSVFDLARGY